MKNYAKSSYILIGAVLVAIVLIAAAVAIHMRDGEDVAGLTIVDSSIFTHSEVVDYQSALPTAPKDMTNWRELNVKAAVPRVAVEVQPAPQAEPYTVVRKEKFGPPVPAVASVVEKPREEPRPAPLIKEAEKFIRHEGQPAKIVIIIDDVGMDKKNSRRAINLPGPLTLAFLPYASGLDEMTADATKHGHQLLIHAPMEPMDRKLNMGPLGLKQGMTDQQFDEMLEKMFASFKGYVGINNHMGSRLTQDSKAMNRVMDALAKRHLLFVDSKTIGSSVAGRIAAEHGLAHTDRDVFLDNTDNVADIRKELHILENIANRRGYAVAIGHPRGATMDALRDWLPTLKARGFELAKVSEVVRKSAPVSKPTSVSLSEIAGPPAPQPSAQPAPY